MECTRCGGHAVVKRADEFFCGKCAIAADWRTIIASVQDARVDTPVAGQVAKSA
jgi:hypothetical protein